jgi:homoserine O-succinyltransferase
MPTKIETETQLTRLLGNTPLQVHLELMQVSSHKAKNVSQEHMLTFYKTFDELKHRKFDGMVITGAPLEHLAYEDVDYWDELCRIMEWTKTNVHSTLHICWAAFAGLYYHYNINSVYLDKKIFGVFPHTADYKRAILLRGFDDIFYVPQSRHATVRREDVEAEAKLKILASSAQSGVYAIMNKAGHQIFITGHSEYDADTLKREYFRDKDRGLNIAVPENYFPDDDDTKDPIVSWRGHANLLFSNWLNYFVYQTTPYDIMSIGSEQDERAY